MEQQQGLWSRCKAAYAKLPEIIRFVMTTFCLLFTWSVVAKIFELVWYQLDKLEWARQAEPYFDKLIVYLPFVLMAVLFLMAFNRIAELLKK